MTPSGKYSDASMNLSLAIRVWARTTRLHCYFLDLSSSPETSTNFWTRLALSTSPVYRFPSESEAIWCTQCNCPALRPLWPALPRTFPLSRSSSHNVVLAISQNHELLLSVG